MLRKANITYHAKLEFAKSLYHTAFSCASDMKLFNVMFTQNRISNFLHSSADNQKPVKPTKEFFITE